MCVVAAAGLSLGNCSGGKSSVGDSKICTLTGCWDEFAATVSLSSQTVPAGTHLINVTADGVLSSCSFVFPPGSTVGDGGAEQCSGGLMVAVQSAANCASTESDGALVERCDAAAGEFTELILVLGTPASVHIQQSVGGVVILDKSVAPTYHVNQPNGVGCDPVCHQAVEEWSI